MRWLAAMRVVPLIFYPLVVYVALEYVEVKYLGIALLFLLLLRHREKARHLALGLERAGPILFFLVTAFAGAIWWSNDETLLRLYPALVNAALLALFGYTLYRRPTVVERFARLEHGLLSPSAVRYTTRLTWVWCIFFVLNALAAAYTALFMSRAAWAIYNGLIAYVLIGALWAGEWMFRRYWMSAEAAR
jgi:uncharacterized membrane protein